MMLEASENPASSDSREILNGSVATSTRFTVPGSRPTEPSKADTGSGGIPVAETGASGLTSCHDSHIQVSVAKKEKWRLMFMGMAIGAVGVFMSSC